MKGCMSNVLLFVGIILIGVGILCYFIMDASNIHIGGHGPSYSGGHMASPAEANIARYAVGGGLALLGLLFVVFGVRARIKGAKK